MDPPVRLPLQFGATLIMCRRTYLMGLVVAGCSAYHDHDIGACYKSISDELVRAINQRYHWRCAEQIYPTAFTDCRASPLESFLFEHTHETLPAASRILG
jgi:hypothetical protein